MQLSACDVLKGKVTQVTKGQTTAHVKAEIVGGVVLWIVRRGWLRL
jgi:molybdopterin-binding protein